MRDPYLNTNINRWVLEKKFLDEYTGFFRLFRNTFEKINHKRQNKFLTSFEFVNTMELIKIRMRHLRQNDEEGLILAWSNYLESSEDLLEFVNPNFKTLIINQMSKSTKELHELLNAIQLDGKKPFLKNSYLTRDDLPIY